MVLAAVEWGSVLAVILGSAVVSGLVTTLLAGRHERQQHIREAMLDVAANFAADALKVLEAVRELDPMSVLAHFNSAQTDAAEQLRRRYDPAKNALADLESQRGRISVLFAPRYMTTISANLVISSLNRAVLHSYTFVKEPNEGDDQIYLKMREQAEAAFERFTQEAWKALERPLARDGPAWHRVWRRVRRTW